VRDIERTCIAGRSLGSYFLQRLQTDLQDGTRVARYVEVRIAWIARDTRRPSPGVRPSLNQHSAIVPRHPRYLRVEC
jgi:hypothetical protein